MLVTPIFPVCVDWLRCDKNLTFDAELWLLYDMIGRVQIKTRKIRARSNDVCENNSSVDGVNSFLSPAISRAHYIW